MTGNLFSTSIMPHTPKTVNVPPNSHIGIVDIGSNTVRLVVFDSLARLPVPIFNEGVSCGLGRGLDQTGLLNPEGVEMALRTLGRFISLAQAMEVESFVLVATAAVREASDGVDFTNEITNRFGCPVRVLSGAEEARMGALGILGGSPKADGFFSDLGGGSLDLVSLELGKFGKSDTLPLGYIRVAEGAKHDVKKAKRLIAAQFEHSSWLKKSSGRDLYAVGGAFRAIARLYIKQTKYPLLVIDNFTIETEAALDFTKLLGGLSVQTMKKMGGVGLRRLDTLPFAALVLNKLIKMTQPKKLVFSGYGLREGQFFEMLPDKMKEEDPLISACEGFALRGGRFSVHGEEIASWMAPLFAKETARYHRLCHAAALLSDIGWTEHRDYRAVHSFIRVLRIPISGLTHRQRVMLALAVYIRYNGKRKEYEVDQVRGLLGQKDQQRASVMGQALRFAHLISGGVPGILTRSTLKLSKSRLELEVDDSSKALIGDAVKKLFLALATTLDVSGDIKYLPVRRT